jgi:hypothetical protein
MVDRRAATYLASERTYVDSLAQPMTVMSIGKYVEPTSTWLSSIPY